MSCNQLWRFRICLHWHRTPDGGNTRRAGALSPSRRAIARQHQTAASRPVVLPPRRRRPHPRLAPSPRRVPRRQSEGEQHARLGHQSSPLSLVAASPAALPCSPATTAQVVELACSARAVEKFLCGAAIENCVAKSISCSSPGGEPPLPSSLSLAVPGPQATTEQGTTTMRMISERVIALLLALVASGAAFNALIV
jgi:hypothetical protein